jgi:hypothetical protein
MVSIPPPVFAMPGEEAPGVLEQSALRSKERANAVTINASNTKQALGYQAALDRSGAQMLLRQQANTQNNTNSSGGSPSSDQQNQAIMNLENKAALLESGAEKSDAVVLKYAGLQDSEQKILTTEIANGASQRNFFIQNLRTQ